MPRWGDIMAFITWHHTTSKFLQNRTKHGDKLLVWLLSSEVARQEPDIHWYADNDNLHHFFLNSRMTDNSPCDEILMIYMCLNYEPQVVVVSGKNTMRNNFPKVIGCTASYFVKIILCPLGFVTPLHLRSPKGGCHATSDDLSCSTINWDAKRRFEDFRSLQTWIPDKS